jgi:hypothetical protein
MYIGISGIPPQKLMGTPAHRRHRGLGAVWHGLTGETSKKFNALQIVEKVKHKILCDNAAQRFPR